MNLSIDEKIGQRFMFGVNDENIDCIIELIKNSYIGGVVLYKKNYNNYRKLLDVVRKLKEANRDNKIPLFIAIDQEGGKVNRMPSDVHVLKNIYDISKENADLVKDSANVIGRMLYNTGINMNLAPVMDIYNNSKSKVLFKRCFYGDSDNVSRLGICYMNKLSDNKVIPVIKHFPGHGASKIDSHLMIPYIFNYNDVIKEHMIPFKNAIFEGTDVVMLGHLIVRKITGGLPASISDGFIKKYLRDEFKFDGLIMTDELNMLKNNALYRGIYLKKALMSLNDVLLIKIKNIQEGNKIINRYKEILLNNIECSKELDNSVKRIVSLKEKYKISDEIKFGNMELDEINKEIDRINEMFIKSEN